MKKYSTDHKSNLNTSCTSQIYSLMSGSMCSEGSLSQSITKINELKKLYNETCLQEQTIQKQNQKLINQLECLKKRLEQMIDENFGEERNRQKKNPSFQKQSLRLQKKFKPGSIAKIKKNNNNSLVQRCRQNQNDNVESYQILQKGSLQSKQSGFRFHAKEKDIQNLNFKIQAQSIEAKIHKKCLSSLTSSKKYTAIEDNYIKTSKNIKDQSQNTRIRSYLSSPRGSIVIKNRNTNN